MRGNRKFNALRLLQGFNDRSHGKIPTADWTITRKQYLWDLYVHDALFPLHIDIYLILRVLVSRKAHKIPVMM